MSKSLFGLAATHDHDFKPSTADSVCSILPGVFQTKKQPLGVSFELKWDEFMTIVAQWVPFKYFDTES